MEPRRTVVQDLGSNSFRMVVYEWVPGEWWRRADELHETVRIGQGLDSTGSLSDDGIERGLRAVELFDHARRAFGIEAVDTITVATSAIRDARNGPEFVALAEALGSTEVRVLSTDEEARYGMLAAVNSTALTDGWTLDIGGGSLQLCQVEARNSVSCGSWPLGAVRMTEHFLSPDRDEPASPEDIKALSRHAVKALVEAGITDVGGSMVAVGGAIRNLAAAARNEDDLPSIGVQGYLLTADRLDALITRIGELPPSERGQIAGIKTGRGEIVLAAAVVVRAVLTVTGMEAVEVTEAGLREGLFFERYLAPAETPLFPDVRGASVRNLAYQHRVDLKHSNRVSELALGMYDSLRDTDVKSGKGRMRELLWAAAVLHDVGKTVDYDDHHLHSKYLILGAGLPGYTPRELALIALIARYHRKGNPEPNGLGSLLVDGDRERLRRAATLLRMAEFLERGRDGSVKSAVLVPTDDGVRLDLEVDGNPTLAKWGAEQQAGLFAEAFGRPLTVS
ncbi:MAG: Ppx/GppA phosphatase family protein [Solirubrobacterales bacterium]|nr:Ppx/GppA phosphatase family protein [Solirubrobacterales bacterium]